jgi:hypothetical protein
MIEAVASAPFVAFAQDAPTGLTGTLGVQVLNVNDTVVVARTTANIVELVAGSGIYQWSCAAAPSAPGPYVVVWDTGGGSPMYVNELLQVTPGSAYVPTGDITVVADLTDIAVLVPWARRACEGPYGPPSNLATMQDSTVYPMVADACSEIILLSGSLFGHTLDVTARDPDAGYPTQWKTTGHVLNQWEGAIVISQVALDYFKFLYRDMKTSMSIKTEGAEYDYTVSANVMLAYVKELQAARDQGILGLRAHNIVLDRYASNIRIRDQATVAILEWWDTTSPGSDGAGMPGGQEAAVVPWTPGWSGPGFQMQ